MVYWPDSMQVYRISKSEYAKVLTASGSYGRWNSEGRRMIYTASSASLACLENLAHRSGTSLSAGNFSLSVIEIPETLPIIEVKLAELFTLSPQWRKVAQYPAIQIIGNKWLDKQSSVLLKVPSAIVEADHNFLLNPDHPDFNRIKITDIQNFIFDARLKRN